MTTYGIRRGAVVGVVGVAGLALTAWGQSAEKTSITIYSSAQPGAVPPEQYRPTPGYNPYQGPYQQRMPVPGYAVVRDERAMKLAVGRSVVRFTDVAALIDPTTVSFASLTDAATTLLEQNYQFDLVSGEKLLEKYIDRAVGVTVVRGNTTEVRQGTLLSSSPGGLVLRTDGGGVEVINGYQGLSLPSLPDGLITRPTLVWDVKTEKAGDHNVRVAYQTEGITWWADYNLIFAEGANANSGTLDVGAWVSILNQSGAGYKEATLKLVAGDVHRAPRPQGNLGYNYPAATAARAMDGAEEGFQEKSFFEYHLYTLGRPATIPDNSTKQIELFPTAHGVACEKVLVYDALGGDMWWGGGPMTDQGFGSQSRKDVNVYLRFKNKKDAGMGMPLPAGRIRVSKLDPADGSLEFIGEDVIRHTPKDEQVLVKMGNAFDVVGERTQADYRLDTGRKTIEETIEIKVRNHKTEAVEVIVQERMYRWLTWEITKQSSEHTKIDAKLVHFPMTLKPDEEGVVRYTVRYTW